MFCIGSNGHVPDDYQPDENKKNWFHPDLTIPVWIPPAKLQNSRFSSFREIYRKPLHIISKPTVTLLYHYRLLLWTYELKCQKLGNMALSHSIHSEVHKLHLYAVTICSYGGKAIYPCTPEWSEWCHGHLFQWPTLKRHWKYQLNGITIWTGPILYSYCTTCVINKIPCLICWAKWVTISWENYPLSGTCSAAKEGERIRCKNYMQCKLHVE